MYIYKITNLVNGKIYIGQTTKTIEKRWQYHTYKSSGCKALYNSIEKYGKCNFKIEILCCVLKKEYLDPLEESFIKKLNCKVPNGYNIQSGGTNKDSLLGKTHSLETRQKMSKSARGKNNSQYNKKGTLSPNYGVKKTKEHVEKIVKQKRKKVYCVNLDKTWNSLKDCALEFNTYPASISNAILKKNRVKRYKGLTFIYLED